MITKAQMRNARQIVELANHFGSLDYNAHGQTLRGLPVSPAAPAMLEREPDEAAAADGAAAPRPLEPSDRHMFAAGDVRDTTGEWMGR